LYAIGELDINAKNNDGLNPHGLAYSLANPTKKDAESIDTSNFTAAFNDYLAATIIEQTKNKVLEAVKEPSITKLDKIFKDYYFFNGGKYSFDFVLDTIKDELTQIQQNDRMKTRLQLYGLTDKAKLAGDHHGPQTLEYNNRFPKAVEKPTTQVSKDDMHKEMKPQNAATRYLSSTEKKHSSHKAKLEEKFTKNTGMRGIT
jgi:hypothetical protein